MRERTLKHQDTEDESIFDEYMVVVSMEGGHYDIRRFKASKPIKGYKINGHRYIIRRRKAFVLQGWYPWTNVRFFQTIMDYVSHRVHTIGLLLYEEPDYETKYWTEPLDRIESGVTDPSPIDILTPDMHQTIADSKLFADAMRKIHFGSAVSWKLLAILLIAAIALILILNSGGSS